MADDYASNEALGQRLKLLRLAISGEDHQTRWVVSFHDKSITVQHWQNWESGRHRPSPPALERIMQRTGAPSDYILYGRRENLPYHVLKAIEAAERLLPTG